jgi:hypothetical protein
MQESSAITRLAYSAAVAIIGCILGLILPLECVFYVVLALGIVTFPFGLLLPGLYISVLLPLALAHGDVAVASWAPYAFGLAFGLCAWAQVWFVRRVRASWLA